MTFEQIKKKLRPQTLEQTDGGESCRKRSNHSRAI